MMITSSFSRSFLSPISVGQSGVVTDTHLPAGFWQMKLPPPLASMHCWLVLHAGLSPGMGTHTRSALHVVSENSGPRFTQSAWLRHCVVASLTESEQPAHSARAPAATTTVPNKRLRNMVRTSD